MLFLLAHFQDIFSPINKLVGLIKLFSKYLLSVHNRLYTSVVILIILLHIDKVSEMIRLSMELKFW